MGEDEDGEGNGDGQETRVHARGGVQLFGGGSGHCGGGGAKERDDDHEEKVDELCDGVDDADDHPGRQEARVLERN